MLIKNLQLSIDIDPEKIHQLILESGQITDYGLLNGKFGIAICFFHLSRHLEHNLFLDYANNQLDEIWNSLSDDLSIEFESGLSGIGWGIEYLIQNDFVKGNSNLICNDIDKMVMRICPRRFNDYSLESGLEGILNYICARLAGRNKNVKRNPFLKSFIDDLAYLYKNSKKLKLSEEIIFKLGIINNLVPFYDFKLDLDRFIRVDIDAKSDNIQLEILGIRDGISGLLLRKILQIPRSK
ncbi:hypothetical protein SF1_41980 [Sphingobacterium faecium NBRC 15299]|uniref:lanthionine synthetase LanC family protein n=1 Tax=Sphingobacterium faecium TaxID=34087 RepID=UPI000D34A171|nr:lanthionine synthetase LanC family protein [Sphingobacterium faecium]PTX06977.1 lanthionine synthetase-like protein [Sphingobacterium faecium]GEM66216.1 hypothetical protein SF1_41980 [Sphingobacterium faecium NBRC 15299]